MIPIQFSGGRKSIRMTYGFLIQRCAFIFWKTFSSIPGEKEKTFGYLTLDAKFHFQLPLEWSVHCIHRFGHGRKGDLLGPDLIPGDVKLSPGLREHLAFLFYATLSQQGWKQDLSLWRHLPLPWTPPLLHTRATGSFTSPGGGSDQQGYYLGRAWNWKLTWFKGSLAKSFEKSQDSTGMFNYNCLQYEFVPAYGSQWLVRVGPDPLPEDPRNDGCQQTWA